MGLALWNQVASVKRATLGHAVAILMAGCALAIAASEPAAAAQPGDGLAASRFEISVDGVVIASFSELNDITSSVQQATATGGMPAGSLIKAATVTLRRELNRGTEMWTWHELVATGGIAAARRSVVLTGVGTSAVEGKPVARYHLENAWPSKIEIGSLKAGASEVLMETVTLTCESIRRERL